MSTTVRVSDDDHALLMALAKQRGVKAAALLHRLLLAERERAAWEGFAEQVAAMVADPAYRAENALFDQASGDGLAAIPYAEDAGDVR